MRQGRKAVSRLLAAALAAGILAAAAGAGWYWMFYRPCRLYEDCRGRRIDVETMKRTEALGLCGWRDGESGRMRPSPP